MEMDFIYGMTQGFYAPRGYYRTAAAEESVERLKMHGINFVALVVNQYQENFASTRIFPSNVRTADDDELALHIGRLHKAGMRVMLKPMLEPLDSVWRGKIRHYRGIRIIADVDSDTVTPWFRSYQEFVCRYATLAEACGCECFCIGAELDGMEEHTAEWRETIRQVREFYSGPVTFNITMNLEQTEERLWLKDLDFVGLSGYYKVGPNDRSSTLEEMQKGWEFWRDRLAKFSHWLGKSLFFAETGTRPMIGAAGVTGGFNENSPGYSEQEQADYYSATLDVLGKEEWFLGSTWWKLDEFQNRPNFRLSDGHYVGCEPTETLRKTMLARSAFKFTRKVID
ncbi:hypothetical protein [uncultured Victivallis sp.]|uniref:glycoside hydrolase family 113 n=1 Tax=uncultured Victivallis sp. TaxID=354118 RepID=UPI00259A7DDC|nr:hypothetical protein [uncultured Victivallis sp.]